MVRAAVQPWSPPVVPRAMTKEDEVEEIEHAEPRPQAIQILCKHDNEVVVIEEEDTTRDMRGLKTALVGVMKQIKVSTTSGVVIFDVDD